MSHANNQAVLWYLEQRLFRKAGSRNRASYDYLDAAHRLVRKVENGQLPRVEEASQGSQPVQHFQWGGYVYGKEPAAPRAQLVAPRAELVSSGSSASGSPVVTGPATLPTGSGGLNITHFGYPSDPYWDSASGRGEGTHVEHMEPGYDVALNKAGAKLVGAKEGQPFQYQGKTYRWGDNVPETYKGKPLVGARMDVFDPYYGEQDPQKTGHNPYVFAYDEYENAPAAPG